MQTLLEREETGTPAEEMRSHALKQPTPEGPEALPAHLLPVGQHHQLAGSVWWIGSVRGGYTEVAHIQGIILYNRTTHIFLKPEEAAEASLLLPLLIQQEQMKQHRRA